MLDAGKSTALISLAILAFVPGSLGQNHPSPQPGIKIVRQPVSRMRQPTAKTFVLPPMPSGPLRQVPMDQIPSTPPQVTFQGGMLTVVAQNSTLGDILREVRKQTGATIDVPPNATERVATRLGPGPARDVLASLLNGSSFNYVMVGSASEPAGLTSVLLTARTSGGPGGPVANAYQPPPQYYSPPAVQPAHAGPVSSLAQQSSTEEVDEEAEEPDAEENADEEQQDQDQAGSNNAGAVQDGAQPNAGPKTPEQILEMLRNRQQAAPGPQMNPVNPNVNQPMPPDQNQEE